MIPLLSCIGGIGGVVLKFTVSAGVVDLFQVV